MRALPFVPFVAGVALGIALLVAFGFVGLWHASLGHSDFSGFWAGPRAALDGVNPYDPGRFPGVVERYGTEETEPVYGYPPWDLLLLFPFAPMPVAMAAVIWTALGVGLALYGLGSLLRRVAPEADAVHLLAGFALFASQPAVIAFYSGQWSFVLTGLLAVSARWLRDGYSARGGALAAIAMLVKPQLFVFAAWATVRAASVRHQQRFLVAAGLSGFALVGGSWLAFPDWLPAFLTYVAPIRTSDPPRSVTLATPLVEILGSAGLWLAVPIIAVTLGVALRFRPISEAWLPVWITASIALTTYGWSYDHVILIVPLVLAVGALGKTRRAMVVGVVGLSAIIVEGLGLYQYAIERGTQSLNVFLPFTVFTVIAAGLWPIRRGRAGPASS